MNFRQAKTFLHDLPRRVSVLAAYLGAGGGRRKRTVADTAALQRFLDSRSSHVAQTTLYGYLRARSGMRFPVLFENDAYVESINHAKWQMWLACLSDLSIYAGGLLALRSQAPPDTVGAAVCRAVQEILERTGVPVDSGSAFAEDSRTVLERVGTCEWQALTDDESVFTASPQALVRHAPIIPELMALDEEIVRNSVRFRWQEVRRELRATLDADAVLHSSGPADP